MSKLFIMLCQGPQNTRLLMYGNIISMSKLFINLSRKRGTYKYGQEQFHSGVECMYPVPNTSITIVVYLFHVLA